MIWRSFKGYFFFINLDLRFYELSFTIEISLAAIAGPGVIGCCTNKAVFCFGGKAGDLKVSQAVFLFHKIIWLISDNKGYSLISGTEALRTVCSGVEFGGCGECSTLAPGCLYRCGKTQEL